MKQILFFILISFAAFAQPKVPYGTTGDVSANSDMWLRYNFSERKYDLFFRDISDFTSSASDSVIVSGTARFKRLIPASSLISAISANMPITYNKTTGTIGINYDSLYKTTDTRYFRLSGTNVNIEGKYMIGNAPIVDRNGNFSRVLSSDSVAIFQGGNASDRQNIYRNTSHLFQDRLGSSTMATFTTSGLTIGGGNATIGNDGRAYFGFRTSIGKAPTTNMLEVAGKGNFDGALQLDQRVDIDGFKIGTTANENIAMTVFGNWNGSGVGRVGDFNMSDSYLDLQGYKGAGIAVGSSALGRRVLAIDTLQQIKVVSGRTGIAQSLTIQNDSTRATAGRGSELKFTATGDTTLASIQVATQTTNNRVGLMRFLTNNGTTNGIRLVINQNGLVGINRTSPTYRLDIAGSMRADSSAYLATIANNRVGIGNTSASYKLDITGDLRSTTGAHFATSSGNVVVGGTSSFYKFGVINSGAFGLQINTTGSNNSNPALDLISGAVDMVISPDNTNARSWIGNYSNHPIFFQTNNISRMVIANDGRVGIGTNSPAPSAALEVNGTTGALLVPRLTTAQRDALTPVPGMIIYNTTLDKLQCYIAASWDSLH